MQLASSPVLLDIERRQGELVELLRTLVRFDTSNPPGSNEESAQEWVAETLSDLGLTVDVFDVYPGRPNVVGVLKGTGGGRSVILNAHIDVAEARLPAKWRHPPFAAVVEDGKLYGRGAADMKGALAGFLFAVDSLRRCGIKLAGDVIVQSVIGEETGEPGTRACVDRGYSADFAIVGECSSSRSIVAAVGIMTACISIDSPYTLHVQARRSVIHAGGGVEGANCVEKMATRVIPALQELERHWAVFKKHPLMPPGQTLINPFRIEGGSNPFIMPESCKLFVTVYYLPTEEREDVQREVEEHVRRVADGDPWLRKYPPTVSWMPGEFPMEFPPADIDPSHPGVKALAETVEAVLTEPCTIGGRGAIVDSGWLYRAGIPTVVYGPGNIYHAHRVDELLEIVDLVAFTKVIACYLQRWCG